VTRGGRACKKKSKPEDRNNTTKNEGEKRYFWVRLALCKKSKSDNKRNSVSPNRILRQLRNAEGILTFQGKGATRKDERRKRRRLKIGEEPLFLKGVGAGGGKGTEGGRGQPITTSQLRSVNPAGDAEEESYSEIDQPG